MNEKLPQGSGSYSVMNLWIIFSQKNIADETNLESVWFTFDMRPKQLK